MSSAAGAVESRPPRVKKSWPMWLRVLVYAFTILFGALVLIGLLALWIVSFGIVAGEEFSPDLFARRSYYYVVVPIARIPLTDIYRTDEQSMLESHLLTQKLIQPVQRRPTRWQGTHVMQGGQVWQGEADMLVRYLRDDGSSMDRRLDWTRNYPKLAAIFWPAVAQAARDELYLLMPDLMELAIHTPETQKSPPDLQAFQAQVAERLHRGYCSEADLLVKLDDVRAAERLYTVVLDADPDHRDALRGRALARAALKKPSAAQEDRDHLKELIAADKAAETDP